MFDLAMMLAQETPNFGKGIGMGLAIIGAGRWNRPHWWFRRRCDRTPT